METFVGCSGFHYEQWEGTFYPEDLSESEWLPYYAKHFNTVEINNSFYNLPEKKEVTHWYEQTPDDFRFTMKGSRYVTHMKKLVDDEDTRDGVRQFYDAVTPLKEKLGCILWQLPGNQHRDDQKLDTFCSMLSSDFTNVMEFRHKSWFTEEVMQILRDHNVCYCIVSAPEDLPEYLETTTDTAYIRFHGKSEWYRYRYSESEMEEWSRDIDKLSADSVYLYFNNDFEAKAIENARQIKQNLS